MITKTSRIKGMHCASCAAIIEKTFKKTEGVESAEVNYGTETAKISFDESKINLETLSKKIEPLGYSLVLAQPTASEMGPVRDREGSQRPSVSNGMGMSESEHTEHLGLNQSKKDPSTSLRTSKLAELANIKKKLLTAIPLAIISVVFMAWDIFSMFDIVSEMPIVLRNVFQNIMPLMAAYVLFYVGQPYLMGFYRFLKYGKANMDTLIGIGTSVAFTYSLAVTIFKDVLEKFINVENVYFDVTIVVITFITLGKYLEARSKIKTGDAIEKLINMQAKTALVIRNGSEQEIPVDEVIHGDLILIKPAGKIPVDGIITEGSSYVDESMITGEPIPVKKDIGENVVAGTINTSGAFTFKATKVGSETMLAHIIRMVEDAQGSKAPIQALADKISAVFVPIVLALSFVVLGLWLLVGSRYMEFSQALSFGLVSFVGILVIACPCALGLATPTAIIVGVGKGAREGILIKDAATLEKLHKANVVVVDKTGTITKGRPELVSIKNFSEKKDEELISILGSLEKNSEHPIAHSVIDYAKDKNISFTQINNFEAIKGKGVKGIVNNIEYYAGNTKLIRDLNIQFESSLIEKDTTEGKTPIIIADKEKVLGVVMIADAVKPESAEAVKRLHKLGIKVVMLTGDDKQTAAYIAKEVGIDEVVAEVLPEDKLNKIKELQQQGKIVVMAGDGVNDAPALAQADIGIAMATGTDVAIESAGITLLHGDISKLVKAITLSKITMRGIKQNLFWAFIYNIVGIPLAAGAFYPFLGWLLNPVFAGFAMAASSVSVVTNSLRIKTKKL